MARRIRLLASVLVLCAAFVFSTNGEVLAADDYWTAEYYNDVDCGGSVDKTRDEKKIDNDWGTDKPTSGIDKDKFCVIWTREVKFNETATYRFTATFDDGMKAWVDGDKIIDEWEDGELRTVTADVKLKKGNHDLKVRYYDNKGNAVAKFSWEEATESAPSSTPTTFHNWKGQYYNNRDLSGSPALERDDGAVDFDWGGGSPADGVVNQDDFSVRWTRRVDFAEGTYRFTATSDDGMRVWVDDTLIINLWYNHKALTASKDVFLAGGGHDLEVEYYEATLVAVAKVSWTAVSTTGTTTTIPTSTTTTAPPAGGSYTVQRGDYLAKIARTYGTTVSALITLNGPIYPSLYSNPNIIYVGWVLKVPDGQGGGGTSGGTYTVQRGDSLARIAINTGVNYNDLLALNVSVYPSLKTNPNLIYTGWVLKLP